MILFIELSDVGGFDSLATARLRNQKKQEEEDAASSDCARARGS